MTKMESSFISFLPHMFTTMYFEFSNYTCWVSIRIARSSRCLDATIFPRNYCKPGQNILNIYTLINKTGGLPIHEKSNFIFENVFMSKTDTPWKMNLIVTLFLTYIGTALCIPPPQWPSGQVSASGGRGCGFDSQP